MYTGRDAARTIAAKLDTMRGQLDECEAALHRMTEEHARLVGEQERLLDGMARIHLPSLSPTSVTIGFKETRERFARILRQHDARKAELRARIEEAHVNLARADAERDRLEREEERLDARRVTEQRVYADRLMAREDYVALCQERERCHARAERLERMRHGLHAMARVEGPRYEADRWIRYLRARNWGRSSYRGSAVARMIDGWLADAIDYERAVRHLHLLRHGPVELEAEHGRVRQRIEALDREREAVEETVDRNGLRDVLRELQRVREMRERALEACQRARRAYHGDAGELRELEAQRGRYYEEALELHRNALASKDIVELLSLAERTPSPEDDRLALELRQVRDTVAHVEDGMAIQRDKHERVQHRLAELEHVARVVEERFGDYRARFRAGLDLDAELNRVVEGSATARDVLARVASMYVEAPRWEEIQPLARDAMIREESKFGFAWFDGPQNVLMYLQDL
jgi:hypothetical protein